MLWLFVALGIFGVVNLLLAAFAVFLAHEARRYFSSFIRW